MAFALRSTFTVAILGFNQTERIVLSSMLALSERRALRYLPAGNDDIPDILVVDGDNTHAVKALRDRADPEGPPAVLIGASHHGLGIPTVTRPVSWFDLFLALDTTVRDRQAAEGVDSPDAPPTIPALGFTLPDSDVRVYSIGGMRSWRNGVEPPPLPPMPTQAPVRESRPEATTPERPAAPIVTVPIDPMSGVVRPTCERMLLIGTSPQLTDYIRNELAPFAVAVDHAAAPEHGIEMTGQSNYLCVLIDHDAPGMGALTAAQLLKSRRNTPKLPVVLFAHNLPMLERWRARRAGVDAVLSKPIDTGALLRTLSRIIPRR